MTAPESAPVRRGGRLGWALLALLLSPGCDGAQLPAGGAIPCTVGRVVDGDTLECVDERDVRLLLIDTPELDQGVIGELAREALLDLAPPGTEVTLQLDINPIDPYGRTLAYVVLPNGRMANEELLRAGVAVVLVYPPNVRHVDRFREVAEEAREAGRGLWSVNGFECLPVDHRADRCDAGAGPAAADSL